MRSRYLPFVRPAALGGSEAARTASPAAGPPDHARAVQAREHGRSQQGHPGVLCAVREGRRRRLSRGPDSVLRRPEPPRVHRGLPSFAEMEASGRKMEDVFGGSAVLQKEMDVLTKAERFSPRVAERHDRRPAKTTWATVRSRSTRSRRTLPELHHDARQHGRGRTTRSTSNRRTRPARRPASTSTRRCGRCRAAPHGHVPDLHLVPLAQRVRRAPQRHGRAHPEAERGPGRRGRREAASKAALGDRRPVGDDRLRRQPRDQPAVAGVLDRRPDLLEAQAEAARAVAPASK